MHEQNSFTSEHAFRYNIIPAFGLLVLAEVLVLFSFYNRSLYLTLSALCTILAILLVIRYIKIVRSDLQNLHNNARHDREKLNAAERALNNRLKVHQDVELALKRTEKLLEQFWQISPDGMRLMDSKGTILQVNDSYCQMVGLPREQLEGYPFTVVYESAIRENMMQDYHKHLRDDQIFPHQDGKRRLWNGQEVWLEFSNSFLEMPSSSPLLLSVIKDITHRKQAELNLQKSEERFRLLFNHANDAVFVNHLLPNLKFGPFLEVNKVACQRLLYSHEDFLSLNPYSIIPNQYYDRLSDILDQLEKEHHAIYEMEFLRKDNRAIPVEISALLFEYKNKPTILSIARDITQRKQAEQQLKRSSRQLRNLASRIQRIREEERAVIAREIHDELGQVLTVLKIQVSLLGNKLQSSSEDIHQRIGKISDFIDQTVESVQRISAKLRPGILDELGLGAAIEWQAQEFSKNSGIVCKCSLLKEDMQIDAEKATAIFRIFQEALTNVARHAQAERVSVFLRRENQHLILEVTDNGRGITRSQIEDPRSLGILGMKERALIFGGRVSIHGVAGKGSNVKVEMPLET